MKQYLLTGSLLLSACCPTIVGPPGDASSIDWTPTERFDDESVIDCKGAKRGRLDIRKSNVTVKNCTIEGDVRVWGLARNASAPLLQDISRKVDYVSVIRKAAPAHTTIENCTITGTGTIPLYIGPGSTFTSVTNVKIGGVSTSTMVYLGAESYKTTISDSIIDATMSGREAVAIDASDHNIIRGTTITHSHGGIYLYRNCGEGGVIRHTTPSYNEINNNVFVGNGVAIWLGSREGNRCYCENDKGWPFGSSASDMDHARFNIVQNNQLGNGVVRMGIHSHPNEIQ